MLFHKNAREMSGLGTRPTKTRQDKNTKENRKQHNNHKKKRSIPFKDQPTGICSGLKAESPEGLGGRSLGRAEKPSEAAAAEAAGTAAVAAVGLAAEQLGRPDLLPFAYKKYV